MFSPKSDSSFTKIDYNVFLSLSIHSEEKLFIINQESVEWLSPHF